MCSDDMQEKYKCKIQEWGRHPWRRDQYRRDPWGRRAWDCKWDVRERHRRWWIEDGGEDNEKSLSAFDDYDSRENEAYKLGPEALYEDDSSRKREEKIWLLWGVVSNAHGTTLRNLGL